MGEKAPGDVIDGMPGGREGTAMPGGREGTAGGDQGVGGVGGKILRHFLKSGEGNCDFSSALLKSGEENSMFSSALFKKWGRKL